MPVELPAKADFLKFLQPSQIAPKKDYPDHGKDWTDLGDAQFHWILFPKTTQEVQKIVQTCLQAKLSLVPSGGRTGLAGGAYALHNELIISFDRMNKIEEFDPFSGTVLAQAGVTTQQLQIYAEEKGFYFPVDLAAKGSSQLGGNVATRVGGTKYIRYGSIKNYVLDLEIVTGKGDILAIKKPVFKDNTGYPLKDLFIGSEGTLGLITKCLFKLVDKPKPTQLLLASSSTHQQVMEILYKARHLNLFAFEFADAKSVSCAIEAHSLNPPFQSPPSFYLFMEFPDEETEATFEFVEECLEKGWFTDCKLSDTHEAKELFWSYRERISESLLAKHFVYKNDISLPLTAVVPFMDQFYQFEFEPGFTICIFGHLGDGNLHINYLGQKSEIAKADFRELCQKWEQKLMQLIASYEGSFSAEHGVGLMKKEWMSVFKDPSTVFYLKELKKVFDPQGICNPGKLLP